MNRNVDFQPIPRWLRLCIALALLPAVRPAAQSMELMMMPVGRDAQGPLVYTRDARGNRVPDFSNCGYAGGGVALPAVEAKIAVAPSEAAGDDTATIQAAIDRVAAMPLGADGFRGAVLLLPGTFHIAGQLRIAAAGVVLRGSGNGDGGTTLIAGGDSRRTLIQVGGAGEAREVAGSRRAIASDYAPVGATALTLESADGFAPGDRVMVHRPSTTEWLQALAQARGRQVGGRQLNREAGSCDLYWDRTITAVEGNRIALDAPITTAIESEYGGGSVFKYTWPDRARNVGVENLRCVGADDLAHHLDENHSWIAVAMDALEDGWVRSVSAEHFAYAAVSVDRRSKRITVADCRSLAPISENGEFRRLTFYAGGQLTLFAQCASEEGRHDFSPGLNSAGPNVFLNCRSVRPTSFCGPAEVWASGVLYDHVTVEGGELWLTDLAVNARGMGWGAANSMVWKGKADGLRIDNPPTAYNWVVEAEGNQLGDNAAGMGIDGSLYAMQMIERLGPDALETLQPATIVVAAAGLPRMEPQPPPARPAPAKPLEIVNGRFVAGGRTLIGDSFSVNWWKGHIAPSNPTIHGIGVTRYVPGRSGQGLTDDLDALTDRMVAEHVPFLQHWQGLWYDRRRDDHSLAERRDTGVRAPFYEMPWARSGQGTAWDGLSRYDLTRFNSWFFERLRDFGDLAADKGLILYHNYYNNHNVVESGAHWVDYPMRPANCIQDTGLPEPPPFDGDGGSIHIADKFYDLNNEALRGFHAAYIRKTLDELADKPNVIHSLGFQYSGPLDFQRFYLDTIKEWSAETGKRPRIALIAAKDVTDAILDDPQYEPMIDVIDMRYWQYTAQGDLWAAAGGQNRAFRELRRGRFGGSAGEVPPPTPPQNVYRQVREYRDRFPNKAIVCLHAGNGALPVLMAGGAQAVLIQTDRAVEPDPYPLFATLDRLLGDKLHRMQPLDGVTGASETTWCLAEAGKTYAAAAMQGGRVELDLSATSGSFAAQWVNGATGAIVAADPPTIEAGRMTTFDTPKSEGAPWLLILEKTAN